jgi:D-arabinose 1-dehydrogenase-like Zn-dependent alcohol dehydrogenase
MEIVWVSPGFRAVAADALTARRVSISFARHRTWISNGGGYAEYMVAEADGRRLVPDKIAWDIAAPLFCGGFSAMSAYKIAKPQPGASPLSA